MPLWKEIYDIYTGYTDADKAKNTIAQPETNQYAGYTHESDPTSGLIVKDPTGKVVTNPDDIIGYQNALGTGATTPYKPLTSKQAYFNPQLNQQINDTNFKAFNAGVENSALRGTVSRNLSSVPQNQWGNPGNLEASTSDIMIPAVSPVNAVPQSIARGQLDSGVLPSTGDFEARTQNNAAARNLALSQGELTNIPTDVATARQQSLNNWAIANKVDPQKISLWATQFSRANGRAPTVEDAADNRAVIDRATTDAQVVALPDITRTIGNNAFIDRSQSDIAKDMLPVTNMTGRMNAYNGLYASQHQPIPSPVDISIDGQGNRSFEYNPLGRNAALTGTAGLPGSPDLSTSTAVGPSGKPYTVKIVKPTVSASSDTWKGIPYPMPSSSGPSSRPTVGQVAPLQEQPRTYKYPDNTEAWLKTAYDTDKPLVGKGLTHTGHALANILALLTGYNGDNGEGKPYPNW